MQHKDICAVSIREEGESNSEDSKFARISATISSGRVDSYKTYFTDKSLENFAARLNEKKVQLKDSHRQGQGFGVSESGEFKDGKVTAVFKAMRGWQLNDASLPTSDQFIEGVREGIITETSVGFGNADYQCNLCDNREWFRDGCTHIPGRNYTVKVDGKQETKECIIAIDNATLSEVSLVSKGANDDAIITDRAQECFREGNLPIEVQDELERSYGIRFEGSINTTGGSSMETKELQKQLDSVKTERDEAVAKVTELEPLAEDGRSARKYMAGQALEAYKVSRGESLQESEVERFEKRAEKMTFTDLVDELDHLRSLAPEKPEVDPGSKTKQPDNSGNPDNKRDQKTERRAVNPPHWG